MKKALIFLLVSLFTIFAAFPAFAIVDKSDDFYVADYADVFSRDFEERIIALNGDLEHYCSGAQLVVVTVDYLDGMYSDEYAMKLFNNWGVGDADENNGMLLLLAVKENKAWLTVGRGIDLSTSEIDDMFEDYFWRDFDRGNFEEATEALVNELTRWFIEEYNIETSGSTEVHNPREQYESVRIAPTIWLILLIIVIAHLTRATRSYRSFRTDGGSLSYLPFLIYYTRMRNNPFYRRSSSYRRYDRHDNDWHDNNDDDDNHFGGGGFGGFGGGRGGSSGGGFGGFGGFSGGGFSGGGSGGGGFGGGGGGRR